MPVGWVGGGACARQVTWCSRGPEFGPGGSLQGWEGTEFARWCWELSALTSELNAQSFLVPEEVRHSAAMAALEEGGDSAQGDPDLILPA